MRLVFVLILISQDICMPAMRAQASAIYVGVITIVASLGPVFVSVLNYCPTREKYLHVVYRGRVQYSMSIEHSVMYFFPKLMESLPCTIYFLPISFKGNISVFFLFFFFSTII